MSPGKYFHIGGDESNATPHDGYLVFVDSAKNIVSRHGKTMIGWDETSAADIDSTVVVQFWANKENARLAVAKGAKVIFSPAKFCYLDMKYTPQTKLGLHWAGYVDVKQAYNWSPDTLVEGITKKDILGIESPLWTETVKTLDDIEYMTFPRICGHAEIGWTPAGHLQPNAHGNLIQNVCLVFIRVCVLWILIFMSPGSWRSLLK